eukprot:Opistho-2@40938
MNDAGLDNVIESFGTTARNVCATKVAGVADAAKRCSALEGVVELALRHHGERLARLHSVAASTIAGVLSSAEVKTKIHSDIDALADWMVASSKAEWADDESLLASDLEDEWNGRFRTWFSQTVKQRKDEDFSANEPAKQPKVNVHARDAKEARPERPNRRRVMEDADNREDMRRRMADTDVEERTKQWEKDFEQRREERRKMREDMERDWATKFDRPDSPRRPGAGDDVEGRIKELRESMDRRRRGSDVDGDDSMIGPQPRGGPSRRSADAGAAPSEDIDYDTAEGKCRACQLSFGWIHEELKRFLERPGFGLSDNLMMAGAHRACSKHVIGRDYGAGAWDDADRRRRGPSMWMAMRKDCIDMADRHRGDMRRIAEQGSPAEAVRFVCEEKERVCHSNKDEL